MVAEKLERVGDGVGGKDEIGNWKIEGGQRRCLEGTEDSRCVLPTIHVSPLPAASCIASAPCSGQLPLVSLILNSKCPSSSSSTTRLNFCKCGFFALIIQLGYLVYVKFVNFLRNLFLVLYLLALPSISEKGGGVGFQL